MTKFLRTMVASAAFTAGVLTTTQVAAGPLADSAGMRAALDAIAITDKAQYTYNGQSYCWYDDGWNGPGWYVCGQYTVRGVGWGGGAGWHGWAHTSGTVVRGGTAVRGGSVTRGGTAGAGRTGGGGRVGAGRTGGSRVGGGGTGGGRVGGGRTGGSRTGGGRGGGGRTGGHGGGRRR